jgi:hypothetical protein
MRRTNVMTTSGRSCSPVVGEQSRNTGFVAQVVKLDDVTWVTSILTGAGAWGAGGHYDAKEHFNASSNSCSS